ncbi:Aftiphilin, partial [Heterocephalus glaber]
EPDIIRMYSSSPPPLDNGGEDDDGDESGGFGGFSEVSPAGIGGFSVEDKGLPTLQSKLWSLVDSADDSEDIRRKQCRTKEELDLFSAKCADLCMDSIKTSDADENGSSKEERKFTNSQNLSIDPTEENVLGDSISVKNGESGYDFVTCNNTNEDDFGDFGTTSGTTPPLITGTRESRSDVTFEGSLEHFPHFNEPGDDFGEFGDTNATSCQEEMVFSESDLKHTSDSLSGECQRARNLSETCTEPVSKLKNGQDSEFGDFDSVPNIQDNCNAFQDSDDFADFSSAGPSQVVDWNAFEDEQKDGCSWAAFGDQQAAETHHRKEVWQSHRRDENIETLETPKMHSVPLATSRGTVAIEASGGFTLLNLDFFGPVDDSSSSSSTTVPGVDPELSELTTSKLVISTSSLKVTDAFARLMSTEEKMSTSTRKPKREEHLSEESIKVTASLSDLTFMHAKVLMLPATLTPSTSSQGQAD